MTGLRRMSGVGLACVAAIACGAGLARAADLHAPLSEAETRTRALEWVAARGVKDPAVLDQVGKLWAESGEAVAARQLFDRTIATFALVDPETRTFVGACRLTDAPLVPPTTGLFDRKPDGPFFAANLRLFYGRYLVQRRMFDEALEVFAKTDAEQVVDPASLFFHKAVCEHQLLQAGAGLATLKTLLEDTEAVPPGYATVAELMRHELKSFQAKSLDEVSRLMTDVGRRLDLGRAGENVQTREEKIVALLDDIIEKLEQQGGGGGGGGGGSGSGQNQSNQSGAPAGDSVIKGATAPGTSEDRNFRREGQWGSLPEKEQTKAKNLINRNFPGHYEHVIKQYFKKLANDQAKR